MNVNAAKLKSCAERIINLLDQRDELMGDVRDIYTEAKGVDIVPKVLRKVIMRKRAKDPAALLLEDDLLDAYLMAMDAPTRKAVEMAASGATSREIEAATGIDHVTVARSVSLKKKHETAIEEVDIQGDDAGHRGPLSSPAEQSVNAGPPSGQEPLILSSQGEQPGTNPDAGPMPAFLRRATA